MLLLLLMRRLLLPFVVHHLVVAWFSETVIQFASDFMVASASSPSYSSSCLHVSACFGLVRFVLLETIKATVRFSRQVFEANEIRQRRIQMDRRAKNNSNMACRKVRCRRAPTVARMRRAPPASAGGATWYRRENRNFVVAAERKTDDH